MLERMRNFDREVSGRMAKAEIALYDAEFSAIIGGRLAEKESARKHRAGKAYRHRKPCTKWARKYEDRWDASRERVNGGNDVWRNLARESLLRSDWNAEQESIAEDAEFAEVVAGARLMEEHARMHEWLKWA